MSGKVQWTTDPHVVRTIAEDSFGGWERALVEAIKNAVDARATRVDLQLPARDILVPYEQQQLIVEDNGVGMGLDDLQRSYCRFGRPKPGHRGTGKVATFVVAERVRLETWRDGRRLDLEFPTSAVLDVYSGEPPETNVSIGEQPGTGSGTRLTLTGFRQDKAPPSTQQAQYVLLRHFQHMADKQFFVNGARFSRQDHALSVGHVDEVELEGVGRLSGDIFLARQKLDAPGLVVYSDGQSVHGPALFGLEHKGYRGDPASVVTKLLGRIDFIPADAAPLKTGAWTMTPQFKAVEKWAGELLERVVDSQTTTTLDERVDRWLEDAPARRYYDRLGEDERATAKRILRERAKKSGEGNQAAERIIARLLLRSLSLNALNVVFDVLDVSSDEDIEGFGELFKGQDKWTLRQVARAASLVKHHLQAIEELEACVADYTKHEAETHRILAENPWMIADDFHSFRSNRQIKTTLKKVFDLDVDDPAALRRPDFFFVLGDAASSSLDQPSRYLLVELKGPDQPLTSAHQEQVTRDARTFVRSRPGFATTVLLGTEFAAANPPDEEAESKGSYVFRALTYERLIARARFRLAYMLDSVQETGAEEVARRVVERQLEQLVESIAPTPKPNVRRSNRSDEAFQRVDSKDVRPFENAIPLYDLKVAAGSFSPERLIAEIPDGNSFNVDDYTWVKPKSTQKPQRDLFVAQVVGHSMNRRIADGAFGLFRARPTGDLHGKVVIAQHRSIHDAELGQFTIKVFEGTPDGAGEGASYSRVTLIPDSDDPTIEALVFEGLQEGDLTIVAELIEVLPRRKRVAKRPAAPPVEAEGLAEVEAAENASDGDDRSE